MKVRYSKAGVWVLLAQCQPSGLYEYTEIEVIDVKIYVD